MEIKKIYIDTLTVPSVEILIKELELIEELEKSTTLLVLFLL